MDSELHLNVDNKRALLAGLALQGIIAKGVNIGEEGAVQQQAATAVRYADALLARLAAPAAR
jgi:hypothetical protein